MDLRVDVAGVWVTRICQWRPQPQRDTLWHVPEWKLRAGEESFGGQISSDACDACDACECVFIVSFYFPPLLVLGAIRVPGEDFEYVGRGRMSTCKAEMCGCAIVCVCRPWLVIIVCGSCRAIVCCYLGSTLNVM